MKRIVFSEPNVAQLIDEALPEPKDGEVQIKLAVSSISSGTERANLTGEVNVNSKKYQTVAKFPRSGGYSSAGVVVKDSGEFKKGDRVALCWSKHNEYINMPISNVYKLPDSISFENAALFNIATFPLAAVRKCRPQLGEAGIVMGLGVLGMIAVDLLKLAGCVPVIAVDPDAKKRDIALSRGADYAFDPYSDSFVDDVKRVTDGGVNVAIEVTGVGIALNQVLDCMAPFGRVALLGCTRNSDFTVDYYHKVHGPGITLIGAHTDARPKHDSSEGWWTQADDIKTLIKLTEYKRLDLASLVESTHSPTDAPEVYTRLAVDRSFPVTQFDWRRL